MDDEPNRDLPPAHTQIQERVFARLQPASDAEEHLARRIALCRYSLEHIQNRLTKIWSQLNKMQAILRQDPLP
ncbi:MAG: hypothetical protein OEU26_33705 [Candidatus Tectomicrobia bacterium]|nr:hypothetical protein [Candidatus Tectomicrobia bacterium]